MSCGYGYDYDSWSDSDLYEEVAGECFRMNDWEQTFMGSINNRMLKSRDLTERQREKLIEIVKQYVN